MFANRLRKRHRVLRREARRCGVTCFRVYDRDIPELPFAVDDYEGRLHIAEYVRPHERTPDEHDAWLDAMGSAAADALGVDPADVWMKRRARQRGAEQYTRFARSDARFVVGEHGLRFEVNLSDYLDTGLFLDHRVARAGVRDEAKGRDVLNLFAYTGAFSVYAASGGARSVTTVDLSMTWLDIARRNFELNDLDTGPPHRFVRADVMQWLDDPATARAGFDLVILDPPTFSNSKRMQDVFDVQRDHVSMIRSVRERLRPGGVLLFSTNFRRFRLDDRAFAGFDVEETSETTVPFDFRNRRIHRSWRAVRGDA
jgi:23S rRNA G2069 N7-methylase RlmK/C1962 C5-methylase RlmI